MTTCSVHTITTHAKHHHHHPSLRFMGSGTGSHSGSGSGSNSPPPPIKTEPQEDDDDCSSNPPSSTPSKTPPTVHSPPVGLLNHRNLVQDEKLVVATLASLNSGDPSNIIKQDLRLIIQSRRKAEGKGELQVDFKTPPKDEQLTSEELEKRARRRELNRLAAKRSREKGQRRKETLIQEIQGLQNRNGALEGALASLVEERDNLVRTLKTHLPHCQDSSAMTRSAQLLAFSNRLAQLLDWTIPGPGPTSTPAVPVLPLPSTEPTVLVEIQAPDPVQPPVPPHPHAHQTREASHHSLSSPSTPLPLGPAPPPAFPSPVGPSAPELPSPSTHYSPAGRTHVHGTGPSETVSSRDLEIDASAAAALREGIERRHHRHSFRVSAPASPTFSAQSASHHSQFSPRSSPPPHPSSLPITPTHLLPSPSHSLPPPLPSPSSSLPPFLPSPSHSLPAHLPSPSRSMPPFLSSPAHLPSPSHLPSPLSHLPSPHLPSPHSHLPSPHSHLPSPSHSLPPPLPSPHSHLPSPHSHLPSPSHSLPPPLPSPHSHLPSPSHSLPPPLPSPSHSFPSRQSSPSVPRPSHLALDTSGGQRDTGNHLVSYTGTEDESSRSPLSNPALLRSPKQSPSIVKRPQSLDLRGVGIIPKKDPALRSPVIPKKDPALRSPVIPKKDPALRSPTIPKKDPALRSPIIESSPTPPVTATSTSGLRSSGMFKRGPVQRVASFHGVSTQNPGEQVTPLNLSKRRKSEDYGSMTGDDSSDSQQTGLSGHHTWPSGAGSWIKREEERELPLNLVCREQPSATITSGQSGLTQEAKNQPKSPLAFRQEGLESQDKNVELTSSVPKRLMRFNSYDGSS
ncbi:uncharacterized protein LOC143281129 isoform X2 [Babylonia areolata]|uniref:uncharacterized protein LOC143281129 isoform X2 n=1 Tax=Babylonia areolata TaxID=304850 RepID=UPI003FD2F600